MSEIVSWVAVVVTPFVAAWCVVEGRGFSGIVAVLTGAMAYLAYVVAGGAVFGLAMPSSMAIVVWMVGVVAILVMRRNVSRLMVLVCRATGAPVPPKVGADLRKIPVETLIQGFTYPNLKEAKDAETS